MHGHCPLALRNLAAEGPGLSRSAFHNAGFLLEPCVEESYNLGWRRRSDVAARRILEIECTWTALVGFPDRKYVRTDHGAGRVPTMPYDTRRSGPLPTALTRVRKGIDRAIPPHIHSLTLAGRTNG
jgi:hypothetical protein